MVVDIRSIAPSGGAVESVVELLTRTLGSYVRQVNLSDPEDVVLAAVDLDGALLGGVIGRLVQGRDLAAWADYLARQERNVDGGTLSRLVQDLRAREAAGERVGDLFAIAVTPEARGAGVASSLVDEVTRRLVQGGAELVIAEAWHNPDAPDALGLLPRCGYEYHATVRRYWLEQGADRADPLRDGCAHCGPVCSCDASIFAWPGRRVAVPHGD